MQSNANPTVAKPPSPLCFCGFCLLCFLRFCFFFWFVFSCVVLCRRFCRSSYYFEYSKTVRNGKANALGKKGSLTDTAIVSHFNPELIQPELWKHGQHHGSIPWH